MLATAAQPTTRSPKLKNIELVYDSNNTIAKKTLDYILSLGVFEKRSMDKEASVDFWTTLSREQQKDIELGIRDIAKGNTVDYNTFINEYR
jgi:hypothetical protein